MQGLGTQPTGIDIPVETVSPPSTSIIAVWRTLGVRPQRPAKQPEEGIQAFVADVGCAAEIDHELAPVKTLGGFAPAFLEFVDPWLNQLPFYDQPPFSPGIES